MPYAEILIADWSWSLEASILGGPFDVRAALIVFGVVTVAAAVIVGAAILMPGIGIVGGVSIVQTCIEVGVIALATGAVAGAAAGRYQGHKAARKAEDDRIRRVQEIREVDHFLDVYFLPSADDPEHARDFSCMLVSYDASVPNAPVVRTEIAVQSAESFYAAVRGEFEYWLRKPIRTDGVTRRRHVAIFMKPYPGDGVFERIREHCEHRAEVEISRVEGSWMCRLDDAPTATVPGGVAMTVFFEQLTAFYEVMAWLANPSVVPYLGALFAVAAAVTVAPRTWLSFSRAVTRVLVVALVWLALAWIYHAGAAAFGQRDGSVAAARTTGSAVGGPESSAHLPTPPPVRITPDGLGDLPPHCIMRIGFVPLATDPSLPRDFSCFVQCRCDEAAGSPSTVTVIEASRMEDFVTRLVQHVREVPLADVPEPVIQIRKTPYPGEGVLRMVKQKLEIVCDQRAIEARIEDETTQ